ncbi:MAG TPA: HAMP domain-containing sensor histidine kinase [Baekduia sp.]|nr:HAMP domain-containing sensor histidine kinase [Baekduia sp.]
MNRRRSRPLGLRARLLAALLFTAAVTLGTAALVLLPSLQDRLENQSQESLRATVRASANEIRKAIQDDKLEICDDQSIGRTNKTAKAADNLARRTNATVAIWDRIPQRCYPTTGSEAAPEEVLTALREAEPAAASTTDGTSLALAITTARATNTQSAVQFVVQVTQSDRAVSQAVAEVRTAFIAAAATGLLVALIIGLALATTLSRRLAKLRSAALRLAREGPSAPPPADDEDDEIGDLSRAFAQMQLALRRQEEARKAFVATASHELRTPLTSLQGNFELLAEDLENGDLDVADAKRQVEAARGQLRRLSSLATELLDLSRLDAEEEPLRSEPVELNELARAVSAEFEIRAAERGADLRFVEPRNPVWARADPGAVARILRILIDNALRFVRDGQPVTVTIAYRGETATATVTDTGPGIPPAEREAIFERFQRGSLTGGEGGFGLGLAIGRELADRLDGSLKLDESYNSGARFVLTLPIEAPA